MINFFISFFLILLARFFIVTEYTVEKLVAYECGFSAFGLIRVSYDIQFYKIALLFLIFDIEVISFFPLVTCLWNIDTLSFLSIQGFVIILIVGFIYEWKQNLLDWNI